MSIQNSMVRHTLLLSLASVWMRGVSMLFQVWLSRRMGAGGIGLLQLIQTVGFLAATLGTAGVRVASMYLAAQERGRHSPAGVRQATVCCLRYGCMVSLCAGTALFFAAPWISRFWLAAPEAALPLRLFGIFLPVSCLCSVLGGWFTACVKIKQLTLVEILMQLVVLAAAALFLSRCRTPAQSCCAIMLANGLGDSCMLLVLYTLYRLAQRGVPAQTRPGMWRQLLRLCLPLAGSDLLRSGLSTAEHLMIPRGLAAFGLRQQGAMAAYGVIHGMVFPILMFPATLLYALADLLVPELARCSAANSHTRIHYLTSRCLKMGLLFACAVAGLLYCIAAPLAEVIYDEPLAGRYLQLFAPLVLMLYPDAIVDSMLKGLGQQVASVRYNSITSALDILLLGISLPRWGMDGYFWSFTIAHGVNFFLSIRRLLRLTHHSPEPAFCAKAMGAAALTALFCRVLLTGLPAALAVLAGAIGYLLLFSGILLLSGAMGRAELQWLRQLIRGSPPGETTGI